MKPITIVCVLFLACRAIIAGNQASKCFPHVHLEKDKPSVYVQFERAGNREPVLLSEGNKGIWLRLHNNNRWPIVLYMSGVPSREYGDASLFYDVLCDDQILTTHSCHVCSFNSLHGGRSLSFSVPAEDLAKGHALRIKFSYSWEDQSMVISGREPEHYVYFYSSQLPENVQRNTLGSP